MRITWLRPWPRAAPFLIAALFCTAMPAIASDAKSSGDLLESARIRAAVYLQGLQQIRDEALAAGTLAPPRRDAARARWRRIAGIPADMEALLKEARKAARMESDPKGAAAADEIACLAATVRRFDARYRPLLGEPPPVARATPAPPPSNPSPDGGAYFLNGQLTTGGGRSAFRPLGQTGDAQDAGTIEFQARGGMRPDEKTDIAVALARSQQVEQIAITNTDLSARAERAVSDRLNATAEVGYRGYGEADSNARDYGEARLRTAGRYDLAPRTSVEAAYGYDRRHHAETAAADFSNQRFDAALRHRSGTLHFESTLSVQRRGAAAALGSFTRREPAFVLETAGAGSGASGVSAALETYAYDGAPSLDSRRLKVDAYAARGRDKRIGAAFVRFERPQADTLSASRGYDDFSLYRRARSADRRAIRTRETAITYRHQRADEGVDFADLLWHRTDRIRGSWLPRREVHLAARYFLNKDTGPFEQHQVDLALLTGWDVAAPAGVAIGLDATAGGGLFIDPARAKHQDLVGGAVYDPNAPNNFDPKDDDAWRNPRNTVRFGGAVRFERRVGAALTFGARLQVEGNLLYNAKPATSRTDVGFDLDARRPVGPAWIAEAAVSTYRSRASYTGAVSDFSRSNVQLRLTYLFNVSGGSAR